MKRLKQTTLLISASLCLAYLPAYAADIASFSPQNEVSKVRQITVKFDEPMVPFGDPEAPDPLTLTCNIGEYVTKGQGRWVDEKIWAFDFHEDLPAGVACSATFVDGLKSVAGNAYEGGKSYSFNTGGPFIQDIRPRTYQDISEDQVFILNLNGSATKESILEHVWCESSELGEQIPIKIIEGKERKELLEQYGWAQNAVKSPNQYWTLQCQQLLPASSNVRFVYDKGVSTPDKIAYSGHDYYDYSVRNDFHVSFSCTRENAYAKCIPFSPFTLYFNAYISTEIAKQITLKAENGEIYHPIIDDKTQNIGLVNNLEFPSPLPENTKFAIFLPPNIKDDMGRELSNSDQFPLKVYTDEMPSLAKFAAAPFGILELYASPDEPPMLPLTVRNIENTLNIQQMNLPANAGTMSHVRYTSDKDIIHWYRAVQAFDSGWISRQEARNYVPGISIPSSGADASSWGASTRILSMLNSQNAQKIELPPFHEGEETHLRPLEVIGIPVKEPGYHIVEVASPALGQALLSDSSNTMYVRTGVLVTNLGVHAKIGRENSLVWVTRLNDGQPAANATVSIRGCNGSQYFEGLTDEQGRVYINEALPEGRCNNDSWERFLFISARAEDKNAPGGMDMAFTLSTWDKGIEYWRFGHSTNFNPQQSSTATTVFDRTLLRAGETVSMKHFLRYLTLDGFAVPEDVAINAVKIVHQGSGQEIVLPLEWNYDVGDGLSAFMHFDIPKTAKLGTYKVFLINDRSIYNNRHYYPTDSRDVYYTGQFQVEEFRLPVFDGTISINTADKSTNLVQPQEIPVGLQINYLSGGSASLLPVKVSAVLSSTSPSFEAYARRFSFEPPIPHNEPSRASHDNDDEYDWEYEESYDSATAQNNTQKLLANKLALTLNAAGTGEITLKDIPQLTHPENLHIEASFADPNGEIVTLSRNATLWPSAVVVGIRNDDWVSITNSKMSLQAVALSTSGKPIAGVPLEIHAQERITRSTRKRLVGGFYSYDSHTEIKDLGRICAGESDDMGLLTCEHIFTVGGNIELIAVAKDDAGHSSRATTSLWVTSRDELWFGGSDSDRIDLLPEKTSYQAGETAKFQIRMPFRSATALVTVEREGIIESHVMQISGDNPTIELKVGEKWGPNVFISALVLRGRLHEVPLYSFYDWGYKNTDSWWKEFNNNTDYAPPTAMVDLSKPAYRMGVASIRVTDPINQLNVKVTTDKNAYQVRSTAKATLTITYPDGTPAANADVALAVVDEALLSLKNNTSWNLYESMLFARPWGVKTSTAQMEIIGRRHYGRKAIAAGGGGGGSNGAESRELFDTLLLWEPRVTLDDKGQAVIDIPVNDSLTSFRVVAIAADGSSRFGTGVTKFTSTQDLQLINGLPPVIRTDDSFRAAITVRNATTKPMKVEVTAQATGIEVAPVTLEIPANAAREAVWNVVVPHHLAGSFEGRLDWQVQAKDTLNGATDAFKVSQRVLVGVPITVRQATLKQLNEQFELTVKQPSEGLPGRGGIQISMVPRLAEGLPAIIEWFERYPYICLEQQTSKYLGSRNVAAWESLTHRMPNYLDEDGLTYYYPPSSSVSHRGSDILTSYILASADQASHINPDFALPASVRDKMLDGLVKFVEGKIQRNYWSPRDDLDARRLSAMEALSRYGRFNPRMLDTIKILPNQWPTTSVIEWMQILQRTPSIAQRDNRLKEAQQILRSRLNVSGTRMGFSTEANDYWWWLMWNSDLNAARLLLATLDDPAWEEDLPKLVTGFIARQQTGTWHTTTSNLWGSFALEAFSQKFENEPIAGLTHMQMQDASGQTIGSGTVDWAQVRRIDRHNNIGTDAPSYNTMLGAPTSPNSFENNSVFLAWPTEPQKSTVIVNQDGTGKPWATIQSLAAVPLKAPFSAGYSITKTITPIDEQVKGQVTRGDIWRVRLDVNAQTDMTWIVINDPIPGGATILGSGLGRDSQIATTTPSTPSETQNTARAWLAYQERAQDAFRAYYEYVSKGTFSIEYTVRLNNEGTFVLPPTRVEALYAPEMFGETPNATVTIKPAAPQ